MKIRSVVIAAALLWGSSVPGTSADASVPSAAPIIRPEEAQIERLYAAVFDRAPDRDGFAYWFAQLSTGVPLTDIAALFVTSPEFASIAGAPGDAAFIDLLYRHVLDRMPDDAGLEYWLDRMDRGLDRVSLVVLFSESAEFAAVTGTQLSVLSDFESRIEPVSAADLGSSWQPGCPVDPDDLRRVVVSHVDFDGRASTGQVIVHRETTDAIVDVFRRLYIARYPIEQMVPVDRFGSDDLASMEANNSSAFNCRLLTSGTRWSEHAYGRAIDINPIQNPYVSAVATLPASGAEWVDRTRHHPALIRRGDVIVSAFAAAGWGWGGDFSSIEDWQHFSATGR